MARAAVFVDGAYLDHVKKGFYGPKPPPLDLLQFSEFMTAPSERVRTYYYHCMPWQGNPATPDERRRFAGMDSYLYNVRRLPRFEVRLGKLAKRPDGFEQKRVDIMLAVDLVRMSWGRQVETAALVTGDSDFVPAVAAAKDAGVLVKLFYTRDSYHDELYEACDERTELTKKNLDEFLLK